jgi:hypothetical protein
MNDIVACYERPDGEDVDGYWHVFLAGDADGVEFGANTILRLNGPPSELLRQAVELVVASLNVLCLLAKNGDPDQPDHP